MKTKEIKGLSIAELKAKAADESATLIKMKANHAVSPIENPLKIRSVRRTIARLKTELNNRKEA